MFALFCIPWAANAQQALPYSYGFEDNNLATDGWTTQNPSGLDASKFMISTSAKRTGTYGFQFSSYSDNGAHTQYLISPELDAANGLIAQFYYKASSSSGTESFKVGYSTTNTDITSFTFGSEISTSNTSWTQSEEFVFPAGTKYVAIYYYSNYQYYLYVDDFTFEAVSDCPKPRNIAVNCPGTIATISWTEMGSATEWNLNIDGTVVTTTNNPYTLSGLELNSTHTVKVQSACGSDWSDEVSFTTPPCEGGRIIEYTLNDSYGDGWNGNAIQVVEGCGDIIATLTIQSGSSNSGTLTLCGDYYEFIWVNGEYASETSFTFTEGGTTLFTKPSSVSDGMVLYTIGTQAMPKPTGLTAGTPEAHSVELSWTAGGSERAWEICVNGNESNLIAADRNPFILTDLVAETDYIVKVRATDGTNVSCWSAEVSFTTPEGACAKPENLAETDITTNSATMSWTGTSDSYVLQYRPWNPAGDDIITTGEMVTYTVDLSQYEGIGSVAIRHYDVSDMFQLIVDDIQVTNAANEVVYTQNFESCGGNMPSEFSNMDLDGDGYMWEIAQSPASAVNGSYGIVSASYDNNVGALTPDNWLILSGIEMGGQMTFQARGQDASYAAENFAIYVSTESSIVEETVTATTYTAENLDPNTPYAWQVKGVCSDEESRYVSSFFKTLDDKLVFATDGDWNDIANWQDAEGNAATALPTAENNVSIEAAANIPAGYLAQANKVTINGGSITIADGGQLKQNSATLKVTMEKEITGYGEGEGNYQIIASPFNGRTQLTPSTSWSSVNLNEGTFDLYAFDPAAEYEWINYESSFSHLYFTADNGLEGLLYGEGYLYANPEDKTLAFEGTAGKSNNYVETKDFNYDETAVAPFNGWRFVGNFFTCNAYINYVDAEGNLREADLYVMNETGDGFVPATSNVLAPLTGAFMKVNAAGKIQYSTEPIEASPALSSTNAPCLPLDGHGQETDQSAECPVSLCEKILVDEANPEWNEDFEDDAAGITTPYTGILPACWSVPVEYTSAEGDVTPPQVYYKPDFNATENGSYSLRMRYRSMLAMPELDENVDFEHLKMGLYVRQSFWSYKLEIGVITDIDNPDESYHMVATVNNSDKNVNYFECNFASVKDLVGEGRYIVFKNVGGSEGDLYSNNYLDDITLTYVNVEDLECEIYSDYEETFESYMVGAEPDCWEVIAEDVALDSETRPQVYGNFNTTAGGSNSLRLKNRCVYAMPECSDPYPIGVMSMTFNLRQPKSIYRLQVGLVDEQGNFTALKTFKCSNTTDMQEMTLNFVDYDCSVGSRVAFRNTLVPGTGRRTDYLDYSINYIDDINLVVSDGNKFVTNGENAMDANASLDDIDVYPNPTTGNLYIDAMGIQKVECYNQMGQLVRVYDNVLNSIDLNNLSEGVYTLRITVPQGVTVRKVVKK